MEAHVVIESGHSDIRQIEIKEKGERSVRVGRWMERLTYGETWNSRDKGGRPESAGIFQFRAAYLAAVDLPKKCRLNIITDKRLAMDEASWD